MRLFFSLIIVLSLFIVPLAAQADELCNNKPCMTADVDCGKDTPSKSQGDAKSDHCVHCCAFSQIITPEMQGTSSVNAQEVFVFYKDALQGTDPQSLLKPPQAA